MKEIIRDIGFLMFYVAFFFFAGRVIYVILSFLESVFLSK